MAKKNTEHSKNFEKVKMYYDTGLWNKARVHAVVGKKTGITAEEYEAERSECAKIAKEKAAERRAKIVG